MELEEAKKASYHLLELGCGQGVVARSLPQGVRYTGVDLSPSLIREARGRKKSPLHLFEVADATQPLSLPAEGYSHVLIVLALQNMEELGGLFANCSHCLQKGGKLLLVINHPCFRIPRQSSWGFDEAKKIQYRRIERYMSPLKVPIATHPGRSASPDTWSFHDPLSGLLAPLFHYGFAVDALEEWCSDKKSEGGAAKWENRAREEIPLFMALRCRKWP